MSKYILKKFKILLFSMLVILELSSCIQTQKYSFNNITNKEINDISQILINENSMQSSELLFDGDYKKILDVDYVLSDMLYNDAEKIKKEYKYWLCLEFKDNTPELSFYVFDYKLYYFSEEILYESKDKVNYDDFNIYKNSNDKLQTLNVFVMYDYGIHVNDKVTTLLNGNLIWFDLSNYGIENLIAGDELIIKYTGEYEVQEIYPGGVNSNKMKIQSIEVIKSDIIEFTILSTSNNSELELVPVDVQYDKYILSNSEGYVVSRDRTFKKYNQYTPGTTVYGSLPKTANSIRVDGLYDYNPKVKQSTVTDQFEVSVLDNGNDIINNLSSHAGIYTPGSLLSFYSYPVMDVDLAMYVNGEFYGIQNTIKVNDAYMWKYTFVMPACDVVIEFKTSSIEYTNIRSVFAIPNFSVSEILKVRYEKGNIGIAPGNLTNIKYSADFEDKNSVLELLEMPIYEDRNNNWNIDGGSYVCYSIITKDERYDITISNGYISVNQKYYRFIGEYIFFEYLSLEAHSFITYLDTFELFTMNGEKRGDFEGLSQYEFIEYFYDDIFDNENRGYIETEFGIIYICNENIFYVKNDNVNTYYLIVGENNFSNIFVN